MPAWLPVVGGLLALGIMVAMGVYALREGDATPATAPPVPETKQSPPSPAASNPSRPASWSAGGRARTATMCSKSEAQVADGKVDAAYYNPSPINVSKAEASGEDGKGAALCSTNGPGIRG